MAMKGYDVFHTDPDTVDSMYCKVCGSLCNVQRSVHGPTSWIEGMGGRGHWHDEFRCPHSGHHWHDLALQLVMKIEKTPSKRLAELMRLDLEDILNEKLHAEK